MMGNGSQPAQNRQHALDDALGVWTKVGRGGRVENFDGWSITKQRDGRWLIARPDGQPMDGEVWRSTFPSLTWAKAAFANMCEKAL